MNSVDAVNSDDGGEEWAHHGWAPAPKHSTVKALAPTPETALTVTCERRVLARVWPRGPAAKQFVVTTLGKSPLLDDRWPAMVAPCACERKQHLLDRGKLVAEVQRVRNVPAGRKPEVDVAGVSRDKPRL